MDKEQKMIYEYASYLVGAKAANAIPMSISQWLLSRERAELSTAPVTKESTTLSVDTHIIGSTVRLLNDVYPNGGLDDFDREFPRPGAVGIVVDIPSSDSVDVQFDGFMYVYEVGCNDVVNVYR